MISTERELAARLNIDNQTLAIAAQTTTTLRFMREFILKDGPMRVLGRGEGDKGIQRSEDAFALIYGESLYGKRGKKK